MSSAAILSPIARFFTVAKQRCFPRVWGDARKRRQKKASRTLWDLEGFLFCFRGESQLSFLFHNKLLQSSPRLQLPVSSTECFLRNSETLTGTPRACSCVPPGKCAQRMWMVTVFPLSFLRKPLPQLCCFSSERHRVNQCPSGSDCPLWHLCGAQYATLVVKSH